MQNIKFTIFYLSREASIYNVHLLLMIKIKVKNLRDGFNKQNLKNIRKSILDSIIDHSRLQSRMSF